MEPTTIYVERPPIEEKCYKAILRSGALIRIKAPQKMGKTLLLEKLLDYSRQQGYRIAKLDLKLADNSVLADLKTFLQWLCVDVSDILEFEPKLSDYWQDSMGVNTSCTRYFQKYLLSNIDSPLVLALDNFERLFKYENIFSEFCLLLRSWYETAKQGDRMGKIWQKLRLVVVNSTEVYPTLDTNRSPFNVGLAIELPYFEQQQVKEMARLYGIDKQLGEDGVSQLMEMVGGHPYLVQEALANLKSQEISLEELLTLAPTEEGIFSYHLREQLECLQDDSELEAAYKQVVMTNEPVQFNPKITFKLHSLGLVKINRNDCIPSCDLYRQYFSARLE
ncbi:AAA-like domain-containing protein [Iningainema tapete]|uniref:AAA-like domain-containing protein n=1 Tax=Iningainema tapete BLCC-T55 TaxID=2748662 RepID=A0A8J6XKW0_9CYAN|nr:AAA-like domain-containing protein [Iningainema tapete BLCC-T55]